MKYIYFILLLFDFTLLVYNMPHFQLLCEKLGTTTFNEKWQQYFFHDKNLLKILSKIEKSIYHVAIEEEHDMCYHKGKRTPYVSEVCNYIWGKDGIYIYRDYFMKNGVTSISDNPSCIKYEKLKDSEFLEGLIYNIEDVKECFCRMKELRYITN